MRRRRSTGAAASRSIRPTRRRSPRLADQDRRHDARAQHEPRFIPLTFTAGSGSLTVRAPDERRLGAPRLLHALDRQHERRPLHQFDDGDIRGHGSDTTAPAAPTGLAATGGAGFASLSWTAATDNVGVDHYNVHRGTTTGFTPSAANRVATADRHELHGHASCRRHLLLQGDRRRCRGERLGRPRTRHPRPLPPTRPRRPSR